MAAADYISLVQQIYIAYFGRPADTRGLANYAAQLNALNAPKTLAGLITSTNSDIKALMNAFAASPESIALYGDNTVGFVGAIYTNVLNRTADLAGLNFWVGEIEAGRLTKAAAALNIAQGALALAGTDAAVLAAKVAVATGFTAAIDTAQELLAYSGDAAAATARVMLRSVTASTPASDFPAMISATLSVLVNVLNPAPSGTTFTLTTGVDSGANFVGGTGDDIFNAISTVEAGVSIATLTAFDSLDGGAGTNTLNIFDTNAGMGIPASVVVRNVQKANIEVAGTLSGTTNTWFGLTDLTVKQYGGNAGGALTVSAATNIVLTDRAAAATTLSVQGGKDISVTAAEVTEGGTINIGTVIPAAGAVTVKTSMVATQTGTHIASDINIKGGTTVDINVGLSEQAGAGNFVTGGHINVTGTGATTSVAVTQTKAGLDKTGVTGVAASLPVSAVTAAPGVNGVTAVSNGATNSVAAAAGVVDGVVIITDGAPIGPGTIKSVTLNSYGAGSLITSNALTSLSLAGSGGALTLIRDHSWASDTLNVTVDSLSAAFTGSTAIIDSDNEIKTLNVTTAGAASTITSFSDTALRTLNVDGTGSLTMTVVPSVLTKIAVSGAAGFSDGVFGTIASLGNGLTSFTTTSSGKITATLDASTQTFKGATGQNVITIMADASKAIAGGSHSGDILVLNNNAATFNVSSTTNTTTNVTGFEVLGLNTLSAGTFDMSTLPVGLKNVEYLGNAVAETAITKAAAGAALMIDTTQASPITFQTAGNNGVAAALSLRLGTGTSTAAVVVPTLTLSDANGVGFGTLNVESNIVADTPSAALLTHSVTKLVDNGLSKLTVSGNAGLAIGSLDQTATKATSFTIHNTSTSLAGVTITSLTDSSLGTLTFSGSGNATVSNLSGLTGKVLSLVNSGSGTATVGMISNSGAAQALETIVLTGNVALGANDNLNPSDAIGTDTGVTVSGATNNAHVNITLNGAGNNATDTIVLGNGNNYITDNSSSGTLNITVGSGGNVIDVNSGGSSLYSANITLGAHTNSATVYNKILVSTTNGQSTGYSTKITGAASADVIVFSIGVDLTFVEQSTSNAAVIAADTTLTAAINHALGMTGMNGGLTVTSFQWQGDTYLVQNVGADTSNDANLDSVVKLVGLHIAGDFGSVAGAIRLIS